MMLSELLNTIPEISGDDDMKKNIMNEIVKVTNEIQLKVNNNIKLEKRVKFFADYNK